MFLDRPFSHVGDLDGNASVATTARRWKAVRAYLSPTIAAAHWALVAQQKLTVSHASADDSNFPYSMPQTPISIGPPKRAVGLPSPSGTAGARHTFSRAHCNVIGVNDMEGRMSGGRVIRGEHTADWRWKDGFTWLSVF